MSNLIVPGQEPEATPEVSAEDNDLKAKVAELKKRLGLGVPPPVEELTPEAQAAQVEEANAENSIKGSDINWDEYELDEKYAHFYPRARFIETKQGPQWVVDLVEYFSTSKQYSAAPESKTKNGEPMNLGVFITWMTQGPEGWKVAGVYPNGSGMAAILFHRQITVSLPDPKLIETETKVETPTDTELAAEEKLGLDWAQQIAGEVEKSPDFGYIPGQNTPQEEESV